MSKSFIILTVDIEDWFQVENFKSYIAHSTWDMRELRVEKNTHRLLDLFDSIKTSEKQGKKFPKATFFVLGWIAKRMPNLVKTIQSRGHEIASHGFDHHLCYNQSEKELKEDLLKSKKLLEDISGEKVAGYRAPSFAINKKILNTIKECGYLYDSSYNSFDMHGRYGHIDLSCIGKKGICYKLYDKFYEIPVSNIKIAGNIFPWGGGGYFRLIPAPLFFNGVKYVIKKESAYLFYIHPWEIDPDQPRVDEAPLSFKLRHYVNLKKTEKKLLSFIYKFKKSQFVTCKQYIEKIIK